MFLRTTTLILKNHCLREYVPFPRASHILLLLLSSANRGLEQSILRNGLVIFIIANHSRISVGRYFLLGGGVGHVL